jgi:hypothetical protein
MKDFALLRAALASALIGCAGPPRTTVLRGYDDGCGGFAWCGPAAVTAPYGDPKEGAALGCVKRMDFEHQKTRPPADMENPDRADLLEDLTLSQRGAFDDDLCCYQVRHWCPGGRALVDGERTIVARPILAHGPRPREGEKWLADALAEHASIASFARATLELMALGAPTSLIADTQRAGADEIRHAEACFALAARFLGRAVNPGPLPAIAPRAPDPVRFSRNVYQEGCVGETLAVLRAQRELADCHDRSTARVLQMIIADETRHAALAYRTLDWALTCAARRGCELPRWPAPSIRGS